MQPDAELAALCAALGTIPRWRRGGFVSGCSGGAITATGLGGTAGVGAVCLIERCPEGGAPPMFDERHALLAEVVGFGDAGVQLVPYEEPKGVGAGARVALGSGLDELRPTLGWRGRVIDALGRPIDDGPPLPQGLAP